MRADAEWLKEKFNKAKEAYNEYQAKAPEREAAKVEREQRRLEREETRLKLLERRADLRERQFKAEQKISKARSTQSPLGFNVGGLRVGVNKEIGANLLGLKPAPAKPVTKIVYRKSKRRKFRRSPKARSRVQGRTMTVRFI